MVSSVSLCGETHGDDFKSGFAVVAAVVLPVGSCTKGQLAKPI